MFGDFNGLPVHALVLHAAVVLAPLASVAGVAFLVPQWRRRLRWPLVALAVLAAGAVFVAKESGEVLEGALGAQLTGNITGEVVDDHQRLGERLLIAVAVLVVLAVLASWAQSRPGPAWSSHALAGVVAVAAVVVAVLTAQTGETGAKARWNPDGSFDYSGT